MDALFPGKHGDCRGPGGFSTVISKRMCECLGRSFHVHAFRHYAVFQWLTAHPNRLIDAQALLGRKSYKTTEAHYAGLRS
jgi:integrase